MIELAKTNQDISTELTKIKNDTNLQKIKQEIRQTETAFKKMLHEIVANYNQTLKSKDQLVLNRFHEAVTCFIPNWQKQIETQISILEKSYALIDKSNPNKDLILTIIAYAKRPLIFTEMLIRLNVTIDSKLNRLIKCQNQQNNPNESTDEEIFEKMEKLQELITFKSKNKKAEQ